MDQDTLLKQIDRFIDQYRDDIVGDIAKLVTVPSVEEAPTANAPFGLPARRALDVALTIAGGMGLAVNDGDGYVGWAELPGQRPQYLATIAHVDVVPPGDGWDGDPYTLRQRDGWLLGRGVADDKGPFVLSLYLLKFFKDHEIPLRYSMRALVGTNEETGMGDVDYYLARQPQPIFCFTPDTDFPVCNGEKGLYGGVFSSPPLAGAILEFEGGVAGNVVPSAAHCVVRAGGKKLAGTTRVMLSELENGLVRLDASGIGGHAAWPEGTINAIGLLVNYLLDNGLCTGGEEAFLQLLRRLHAATDGSSLSLACRDERFGALSCIGGTISFDGSVLRQGLDIRYPTSTTGDALTQTLTAAAKEAGAGYTCTRASEPFYIEADDAAIAALQDAYTTVTGHSAAPYTIGGGTYARHFARAVSFGPANAALEIPLFAGAEHAANEGANLAQMLAALKIYILAMYKLQQLEL